MDPLRLKGAAGGGAPVVHQNGAPLGEHGLLVVVLGEFAAPVFGELLQPAHRVLIPVQLFPKGLRQHVLGQVVAGRAQAAGGDDNVRPLLGDGHRLPGPLGVVPHHCVPIHIQPQGAETLGEHLSVGVGDAAQQQLGAHRQDFHFMRQRKDLHDRARKRHPQFVRL